jgi:molybdate/tungstate transport system permease protein
VLFGVCTPLAWMLARGRLPFPRVWEAGVLCSLLLPPLVIGLLLAFMVGPYTAIGGLLAHLHLSATNTFLALVIAEVYESAPYYVVGAQAAFQAVDPRLEEQAELLGDRPRRVFRRITLPLASPGLATALAVAWARAMGAFGAVIIIAYHPYGLPLQIYTTLDQTGLPNALPYALVLLVVALPLPLAAYIWSARAQGRRRG